MRPIAYAALATVLIVGALAIFLSGVFSGPTDSSQPLFRESSEEGISSDRPSGESETPDRGSAVPVGPTTGKTDRADESKGAREVRGKDTSANAATGRESSTLIATAADPRDEVEEAEERQVDAVPDVGVATATVAGVIMTTERLPLEGESIHLQSPSLRVRLDAVTDESGQFSFPEVQPGGDYRLWGRPSGDFMDFNMRLAVPEEGLDVDVVLQPLARGRITGRMVDSEGNPVPRFVLWLGNTKALDKSIEVRGDDEGRFEVDNAPAGKLFFETRSPPRFAVQGIALAAEATAQVSIVIDTGVYQVSGIVTDIAGEPLPAARVEMHWHHSGEGIRSSSYRRTATDSTGSFTFTQVGRGTHRIKVSLAGQSGARIDYEVGSGEALPPIRLGPLERP